MKFKMKTKRRKSAVKRLWEKWQEKHNIKGNKFTGKHYIDFVKKYAKGRYKGKVSGFIKRKLTLMSKKAKKNQNNKLYEKIVKTRKRIDALTAKKRQTAVKKLVSNLPKGREWNTFRNNVANYLKDNQKLYKEDPEFALGRAVFKELINISKDKKKRQRFIRRNPKDVYKVVKVASKGLLPRLKELSKKVADKVTLFLAKLIRDSANLKRG